MSKAQSLNMALAALVLSGATASAQNLSNVAISKGYPGQADNIPVCAPNTERPCTAQLLQRILKDPSLNLKITAQLRPDGKPNCYGLPCF